MFTSYQHRHVFTCFMIATPANNLQNGYLVRLSADFAHGLQGTKYDQIILPLTIFISPSLNFHQLMFAEGYTDHSLKNCNFTIASVS